MATFDDLDPLISSRGVLLIGEFHGTEQFPALVESIVEHAHGKGLAVTLGVEIPCSEQRRIDDLFDDPTRKIDGDWWSRAVRFRDGRTSSAMAQLLSATAQLAASRADIEVVAMDGPWVAPGSPLPLEFLGHLEDDRDQAMASRLLDTMDTRPRAFTIVLAGNEHTSLTPRRNGSPRTMASYIHAWHRSLTSLNGQSAGGTAWILAGNPPEGAVRDVAGLDLAPGASWATEPGDDGHHGYVHVGNVTASLPHNVER